jgi:putative tricarboxylic transport membrane protein
LLAVSAPRRIEAPFEAIPTWNELGVDCVLGAWRGIAGAQGIEPAHVAYWEDLLRAVTETDTWRRLLAANGWTPSYMAGSDLREALLRERRDFAETLRELRLL